MYANKGKQIELKPLDITCTSVDCENDLHCFKQTREMRRKHQYGRCRACGAELVDWERLYKRDLSDVVHTFNSLKYELIRHHFWHLEIDQKAVNHACRKGKIGIRTAAENRIRKYVGPAKPVRDGRQTPKEGNAIFYAQHATASCCRTCIEYWHNIPKGRELTDEEIDYLTNLILLYIEERLPFLKENGEKIPVIRYRLEKTR